MNSNFDPAEAGAMACLDCGRILLIGTACVCADALFVNHADDDGFHRDHTIRPAAESWWRRT
jgi:hypothetical protein